MSFGLFSLPTVFAGLGLLAAGLWLAQRLRVEHREVEVISTVFWQAALEDTRARVFRRRFRHWPAWSLLVLIAASLWLLLNKPQTPSWNGTRHILLLDWSVDDQQQRKRDLETALEMASRLPDADREIVAVGRHLETLLKPQEPLQMARQRSHHSAEPAPPGLDWAIETFAARARPEHPIVVHVVGNAPIDRKRLRTLLPPAENLSTANSTPSRSTERANFQVLRLQRESSSSASRESTGDLATLGLSDAANGRWNQVDVWIKFADHQNIDPKLIEVLLNQQQLQQPITARADGMFEITGVPAASGLLEISYDNRTAGALTLPNRQPIQVHIQDGVPGPLQQLIALDPACEVVGSQADPDVVIGFSSDATFRLTADNQPAFQIETPNQDPQAVLSRIVDDLALRQIDATGIAVASGRIVDVQIASGTSRSLAVWRSLFTPAFDFQESRACPIVVGRALRWLAARPPLVEWAELGRKLPSSAPAFDRAVGNLALTNDGRKLRTTRITASATVAAKLPDTPSNLVWGNLHLIHGLGMFVVLLLILEWVLFQKGHIP